MPSRWHIGLGAAAVALALAAFLWSQPERIEGIAPIARAPRSQAQPSRVVPVLDPVRPAEPSARQEPDQARQRAYQARAQQVQDACDLHTQTRCQGQVCAAVAVTPDLDRFGGWLAIATTSPRLVATTVARDLGLPVGALPCGAAVDALIGTGGIRALELPGGTEVWCTVDAPAGTSEAAGRELCADIARSQVGQAADGLTEPDLRQLHLDNG